MFGILSWNLVGVAVVSVDVSDSLRGMVVFRLDGRLFALLVAEVGEVVPIAWLAKPPGMPPVVEGILNLAGRAVPVLRLDRLLGLAGTTYKIDASILIMRGDEPSGLLVEHVEGVRPASAFTVMPVKDGYSFNGCLAAELDRGGEVIHLLSWPKLLLAEEKSGLAAFQARAQARLAEMGEVGS
jgi:purine-binding chemotaxis protein CheW